MTRGLALALMVGLLPASLSAQVAANRSASTTAQWATPEQVRASVARLGASWRRVAAAPPTVVPSPRAEPSLQRHHHHYGARGLALDLDGAQRVQGVLLTEQARPSGQRPCRAAFGPRGRVIARLLTSLGEADAARDSRQWASYFARSMQSRQTNAAHQFGNFTVSSGHGGGERGGICWIDIQRVGIDMPNINKTLQGLR